MTKKQIILAIPICPHDTAETLRNLVDRFVCVAEVGKLLAIGPWYAEFPQVTDDEVVKLLKQIQSK